MLLSLLLSAAVRTGHVGKITLVIVTERRPTLRCFSRPAMWNAPWLAVHIKASRGRWLAVQPGKLPRLVRWMLWHGLGSRAAETANQTMAGSWAGLHDRPV